MVLVLIILIGEMIIILDKDKCVKNIVFGVVVVGLGGVIG